MRKVIIFGSVIILIAAFTTSAALACGGSEKCAKRSVVNGKLCSSDQTTATVGAAKTADEGQWEVRTISIKGMTCVGCETAVKAALTEVPGVVEVVTVSYVGEEASVKVDPAKVDDVLLTKAVTDKGYKAEIIPAVAKTAAAPCGAPICPMAGGKMGADGTCPLTAAAAKTETEKKVEGTK